MSDAIIATRTVNEYGCLPAESLYGVRKMWHYLKRRGLPDVARCTVERLMRDLDYQGMVQGKGIRTTRQSKRDSRRAPDLLDRDFTAQYPTQKWVTDFTYVPTWRGFVYVAFVTDLFSRRIMGWSVSTVMDAAFAEEALLMAVWARNQEGHPLPGGPDIPEDLKVISHSDAASQYTSVRFTDTLDLEGFRASTGSFGDAHDNAVAESVIGLCKNEDLRKDSPCRTGPLRGITDVEAIIMDWVTWYNTDRLHSTIGNIPPIEAENNYYQTSAQPRAAA